MPLSCRVWTIVTPFLPDHQDHDALLTSRSVGLVTGTHKFNHGLSHLLQGKLHSPPLARRPRTHPLQTGSHSASLSAVQGSCVPGRLLYASLRHSQPTSFTVSHSTSPDCTTLPTRHFRSSGLLCRWSVGPSLSLVRRSGTRYRTVSVTRRSPATASNNCCWRRTYFVVTTQHTLRSRDASWLCTIRNQSLILTLTWT